MPISTSCPHCDTHYNLPDAVAGKKVRCKKCQETFPVAGTNGTNGTNGHAANGGTVPVICPHCETPAKSRAVPGTKVRCKRCGEGFTVTGKVRGPARKTALANGDADEAAIQAKVRKSSAHDEDEETNGKLAGKARNGKADDLDDDDAGPRNRLKDSLSSPKNRKTQHAGRDDEDDDDAVPEKTEAKTNKKTMRADRDDDEDDDKEEKAKKSDDEDGDGDKKKKKKKKKRPKSLIDILLSDKHRKKLISGGGGILAIIAAIFFFLFGGEPSDDVPKPPKKTVQKKKMVDDSDNKDLPGTAWRNLPVTVDGKPVIAGLWTLQFAKEPGKDGSLTVVDGRKKLPGSYELQAKDVVKTKIPDAPKGLKDGDVKISVKGTRLTWTGPSENNDAPMVVTFEYWEPPAPRKKKDLKPNDPYRKMYERLVKALKDPETHEAEIKIAAEWFKDNFDPEHDWRPEIAEALELPLDDKNLKTSDVCWESYTMWVPKEDVNRLRLYLTKAPKSEHRQLIMYALADFGTKDAMEILASTMDAQGNEQELAQSLLAGALNMDFALAAVREYVYHHDPDVRNIAYSLREIYGENREDIPRLPPLKEGDVVTYDSVAEELKDAKDFASKGLEFLKWNWGNPTRMRQLAVIGWLQSHRLSEGHWVEISKILDPIMLSPDQFMRTETLRTLLTWVSAENVESLVKFYKDGEFKYERSNAVNLLKRIQVPKARLAMLELLEEMLPETRNPLCEESRPGLGDSYLESFPPNDMGSRMALLKLFNCGVGDVRQGARRAVKKYLIEREYIFDQCKADWGDTEKGRAIHAWQWLINAEPLIGRVELAAADDTIVFGDKYIRDLQKELIEMAKADLGDKPEPAALLKKTNAIKTLAAWAKAEGSSRDGQIKYWVKVIENKEYHEADWKNCRHWAINNVTDAKVFKAIPGLVFRYKDVQDKDKVAVNLQRFAKINWPEFDQALCDTFKEPDKAKKIEVLKIMELEGGPGCFKTLEAAFETYKDRVEDADLLSWINKATEKVTVRMKKEKEKEKDGK